MSRERRPRLSVMVSSAVYGNEALLERVYALLTGFGYRVWMSHKGTLPALPGRSAFDTCLHAVERCDLYLGIISTSYGTGRTDPTGQSIVHDELLKAIELSKPRWILAHDHIIFARILLRALGYSKAEDRATLTLQSKTAFGDLRLIDMYEAAIQDGIPIAQRVTNWVQKYTTEQDALLFIESQLGDYNAVRTFLQHTTSDISLKS